jgi:hypothetical protein
MLSRAARSLSNDETVKVVLKIENAGRRDTAASDLHVTASGAAGANYGKTS